MTNRCHICQGELDKYKDVNDYRCLRDDKYMYCSLDCYNSRTPRCSQCDTEIMIENAIMREYLPGKIYCSCECVGDAKWKMRVSVYLHRKMRNTAKRNRKAVARIEKEKRTVVYRDNLLRNNMGPVIKKILFPRIVEIVRLYV